MCMPLPLAVIVTDKPINPNRDNSTSEFVNQFSKTKTFITTIFSKSDN